MDGWVFGTRNSIRVYYFSFLLFSLSSHWQPGPNPAFALCQRRSRSVSGSSRVESRVDETHQEDLIEGESQSALVLDHDSPAGPLDIDGLAVLEHVIDAPVQHELVAILSKGEDLLQLVFARLDGAGPEAVPQGQDVLVARDFLGSHDEVGIGGE